MISAQNKGENMGRYYSNAKEIVENTTKLSIFKLKEFGLLCGYAATTLTWKSNLSNHKNSIGILALQRYKSSSKSGDMPINPFR